MRLTVLLRLALAGSPLLCTSLYACSNLADAVGPTGGDDAGPGPAKDAGKGGTGATGPTGPTGPYDAGPPIDAGPPPPFDASVPQATAVHVYQTSRGAGPGGAPDHLADEGMLNVSKATPPSGVTTITVDFGQPRQTILGFGAALTEAAASVINGLPQAQQQEFYNAYYGPNGSGYTLARTHIGSCDFALAQYSYDDQGPDPTLANFSIDYDKTLLIPFLKNALAATGGTLKILSSPWSAPGWMKDNGQMKGNGSDGHLLTQYYSVYAQYLSKYLQAYKAEGINIWGITTQNEATGVGGSREGMEWAPADMNTFIRDDLGPQFAKDGFGGVQVYFFDHNKGPVNSDAVNWANTILHDTKTNPFVAGTSVHWYGSTFQTYEDSLDAINTIDTGKQILFAEGTADALGDTGYGASSAGFKYSWMKDDYYWTKDGYDWGYWFASRTDHPIYEPVYRYLRDIIVGLNHWYVGWIDWNGVLNKDGGPGHEVNPIPAAIMVDQDANTLYYSPIYYAMQHFSKFLRPQARVAATAVTLASGVAANDYDGTPTQDGNALLATAAKNTDGSVAIVLFNETGTAINYAVVLGGQNVTGTIPPQALQTLVWPAN